MLFLLTCFPSGSALKQLHLLCQALSTTHLFPRSPSCPLRSLPPHFELFKKMSSNKIHQLLRVKQYNRSEASNLNLYRGQVWKPLGIGLNHSSSSIPLCDLRKVNQFLWILVYSPQIWTSECVLVCMYPCVYVCMCVCYVSVCVYMWECVCISMYLSVWGRGICMYICVYICVLCILSLFILFACSSYISFNFVIHYTSWLLNHLAVPTPIVLSSLPLLFSSERMEDSPGYPLHSYIKSHLD